MYFQNNPSNLNLCISKLLGNAKFLEWSVSQWGCKSCLLDEIEITGKGANDSFAENTSEVNHNRSDILITYGCLHQ